MEADKAGVWFAFVIWPRNVSSDTCALNFLRLSFGVESVGYEDQPVEQAVELVRDENIRLQQMKRMMEQQYYAQQQMMFAAARQQAASMMALPQGSMPTSAPGALPGALPPQSAPQASTTASTLSS